MKQLLRLVVLAALVVLIGFGVWAIFFQKDNSVKIYDTLTTMMDTWEKRENDVLPGYTLYDEEIYSESTEKTADVSNVLSLLGTGKVTTGTEGSYASVHQAQMVTIKYYYSIMQFAGKVKAGDVKNASKKVNDLTSSMNALNNQIGKIALYQDSIKKAALSDKDVLYLELANMYNNLIKEYKSYLIKQNDMASFMKKLVTAYVFDGSYLYDAKGAMLESFLAQANVVLAKEIGTEDCYNGLRDMQTMYAGYSSTEEIFFNKSSADFTTSYTKLVNSEQGKKELEKIFAVLPTEEYQGKQQLLTASIDSDVELFSYYGFGSEYYADVLNIIKFLYEV